MIVVAAASVAGQLATYPNLEPWYAGLAKPSFNPPNWIFYSGLDDAFPIDGVFCVAHFAVAADFRSSEGTRAFFIQLALNAAWSWMFFAAHSPLLGIINIVPQWLIIIATIVAFYRLDKIAAWCLFPWRRGSPLRAYSIWRSGG